MSCLRVDTDFFIIVSYHYTGNRNIAATQERFTYAPPWTGSPTLGNRTVVTIGSVYILVPIVVPGGFLDPELQEGTCGRWSLLLFQQLIFPFLTLIEPQVCLDIKRHCTQGRWPVPKAQIITSLGQELWLHSPHWWLVYTLAYGFVLTNERAPGLWEILGKLSKKKRLMRRNWPSCLGMYKSVCRKLRSPSCDQKGTSLKMKTSMKRMGTERWKESGLLMTSVPEPATSRSCCSCQLQTSILPTALKQSSLDCVNSYCRLKLFVNMLLYS